MSDKYKCSYCKVNFSKNSVLTAHIKRKHTFIKDFKCEDCEEEFFTKADLNTHILQSHANEEDAFHCIAEKCNEIFYRESNLRKHMKSHEKKNEILYICEHCVETFNFYDDFKLHKEIHKKPIEYKCTYEDCDKVYTRSNGLTEHVVREHTKNYPYTCIECNRHFVTKNEMEIHTNRFHTFVKNFKCEHPDCKDAFYTTSELKRHQLVHTDDKPYPCDKCTNEYRSHESLQEHIRRHHTKVYSHFCKYDKCDAKFFSNNDLSLHVKRYHTKIRPYACDLCEYSFFRSIDLTRHKNDVHELNEKYKCEHCDMKFKRKESLTPHFKYNHTEEGIRIRKKKEYDVALLLKFHNIPYKPEHHINFKCINSDDTFCRIDFVILRDGMTICLEVDEEQHSWYSQSCETRRMAQVFQTLMIDGNTLPIVFIRYNPDVFYTNGVKQRIPKKQRQETLINEITNCSYTSNTIKYLFYNTTDTIPDVLDDEEYLSELKPLVQL